MSMASAYVHMAQLLRCHDVMCLTQVRDVMYKWCKVVRIEPAPRRAALEVVAQHPVHAHNVLLDDVIADCNCVMQGRTVTRQRTLAAVGTKSKCFE